MEQADAGTGGGAATTAGIASAAREVEEFVAGAGWDQPPQLFALVPTADLLAKQPELASQLDTAAALTPIAQDSLPESDMADALARIAWPETVYGCALAHEIVVLPPGAEADLLAAGESEDAERLQRAAANHPQRTEARLVAAVSRDGSRACVMRLRGKPGEDEGDEPVDEVVEHPGLAPNLLDALEATLEP
ncbi:MAG: hypothetical protein GEU86_22835 [Actinophytocola sp.]|nr:hypothetical protein [Actinophytocola sp.]